MIDRIVSILKDWEKENQSTNRDDYDCPSWAFRQADRNGVDRTLKKVITLLDHKG